MNEDSFRRSSPPEGDHQSIQNDFTGTPSTISREIARNGGVYTYRAASSDERAWERSRRPKSCVLAVNERLQKVVAQKLQDDWSPQQVSGWLRFEYQNDTIMQVSHETIYRSLFIQARGVLNKELIGHLRSKRMMRRGKSSTTAGQPRGQIVDAISISERPPEIEGRAIPGHWEGDLISGSKNNCYDNAVIESFFGTLKAEYFYLETIENIEALEVGVNDYIYYYDNECIKSGLQGPSPVDYRLKGSAQPAVSHCPTSGGQFIAGVIQ